MDEQGVNCLKKEVKEHKKIQIFKNNMVKEIIIPKENKVQIEEKFLNNRLTYLYQKRNQVKKERNRNFYQFRYYSILPWKIWGVMIVVLFFVSLVFRLNWKVEEIFAFLGLLSFFLLVTFLRGIYWVFKIKKCVKKIDKIDEKIAEEISKSNF